MFKFFFVLPENMNFISLTVGRLHGCRGIASREEPPLSYMQKTASSSCCAFKMHMLGF